MRGMAMLYWSVLVDWPRMRVYSTFEERFVGKVYLAVDSTTACRDFVREFSAAVLRYKEKKRTAQHLQRTRETSGACPQDIQTSRNLGHDRAP